MAPHAGPFFYGRANAFAIDFDALVAIIRPLPAS